MIVKASLYCVLITLSFYSALAFSQGSTVDKKVPFKDFRNFYGICWRGKPHDNLIYARQMGYDYVFYQDGMELDSLSNNLQFYIETPEYYVYNRIFDTKSEFSDEEKSFYENFCALNDSSLPFPYNLASGWAWKPGSNVFTVLLDFQKKEVISWTIDSLVKKVQSIESRNPKFRFAGFAWDEPRLEGDFWDVVDGKRTPVNLNSWRQKNKSADIISGRRSFKSYQEGHTHFFKEIYLRFRKIYPSVHFIGEPYQIYEGWIKEIEDRSDARDIMPDILCQEGAGTQFADDLRIYDKNLIKRENIFSTTPDVFDEDRNLLISAKAAINGSWTGWYGRFGGSGNMPDFKSIKEVPFRLKLIRMMANWENRNNTPLASRKWDGVVYRSENAFASSEVIYIRQPGTNKIFIVFLSMNGKVFLEDYKGKLSISKTDDLFIEIADGSNDFFIDKNMMKPNSKQAIGKGYILLVK